DHAEGLPEYFGTIGVSSNIIDATWQALVDGYDYHLIHIEENGEVPSPELVTSAVSGASA
ncbi:MAG TPA: hypothetical protein VGB55_11040, partial [Tepidisphaeraceae bacterium]